MVQGRDLAPGQASRVLLYSLCKLNLQAAFIWTLQRMLVITAADGVMARANKC